MSGGAAAGVAGNQALSHWSAGWVHKDLLCLFNINSLTH